MPSKIQKVTAIQSNQVNLFEELVKLVPMILLLNLCVVCVSVLVLAKQYDVNVDVFSTNTH